MDEKQSLTTSLNDLLQSAIVLFPNEVKGIKIKLKPEASHVSDEFHARHGTNYKRGWYETFQRLYSKKYGKPFSGTFIMPLPSEQNKTLQFEFVSTRLPNGVYDTYNREPVLMISFGRVSDRYAIDLLGDSMASMFSLDEIEEVSLSTDDSFTTYVGWDPNTRNKILKPREDYFDYYLTTYMGFRRTITENELDILRGNKISGIVLPWIYKSDFDYIVNNELMKYVSHSGNMIEHGLWLVHYSGDENEGEDSIQLIEVQKPLYVRDPHCKKFVEFTVFETVVAITNAILSGNLDKSLGTEARYYYKVYNGTYEVINGLQRAAIHKRYSI